MASDGVPVALAALEAKFWENFCRAVDRPDWAAFHGDQSKQDELRGVLNDLFMQRSALAWDALLGPADCCFTLVPDIGAIHELPHYQERGILGVGEDDQPWMRSPIRVDRAIPALGSVPAYGQHTREVLTEYGFSAVEIDYLAQTASIKAG
jgi:crotonobetainyl-CoA:carnitine CoA-transferase CaiB-like acyl-CoA transferase